LATENNYEKLHLEEIQNRHEEQIKVLQEKLNGLPERLENVEKEITTLSASISDFIKELRKGYVSYEICHACMDSMSKDIESNKENTRFLRNVLWACIGGCVSLIIGAMATKIIN
jgi:uncharacterized protein (UPF0335 family)